MNKKYARSEEFYCDKIGIEKNVKLKIYVQDTFAGESNFPIHSFEIKECSSFPLKICCHACEYKPII